MISLIIQLLAIYKLILLAKIFMSWINPDPYNPIVKFINSVTDPILIPIRDMLPKNGMGIDFSPLIIFLGIAILEKILLGGGYGYY